MSKNDNGESRLPSLEDVSTPYVSTLTTLRTAYENSLQHVNGGVHGDEITTQPGVEVPGHSPERFVLSQKAREDQRKFRALDREESYFDSDDMGEAPSAPVVHSMLLGRGMEGELHRTPRMLSLLHNDEFDGGTHQENEPEDKPAAK